MEQLRHAYAHMRDTLGYTDRDVWRILSKKDKTLSYTTFNHRVNKGTRGLDTRNTLIAAINALKPIYDEQNALIKEVL